MDKITATKIIERLSTRYIDKPFLKFNTMYELLVAVILSAQCTDERVNKVTQKLFESYNTPQKMVTLTQEGLEAYIFSCGLYKNKAKNILSMSYDLIQRFNGEVPNTFDELISLNGVGRKTANVVLSVGFNTPAIAVDTHVFRVAKRIGFASGDTPLKVENALMRVLDKKDWRRAHHYLISLGRDTCKAGKGRNCKACVINELCQKK